MLKTIGLWIYIWILDPSFWHLENAKKDKVNDKVKNS